MTNPLILPVAALAAGIFLFRIVSFQPGELLWALGGFFVLGTIAALRRSPRVAGAAVLAGFVALGALIAYTHVPGPSPEIDATGREIVILEGCVVEPPAISGERERFLLELDPGARAQVTLYTREGAPLPRLRYGQRIELDARIRKPRNYGNPGAFDYAHYLARQDIYWTASGAADTVHVLPGRCGSPIAKAAMDLRAAILARVEQLYRGDDYKTGMTQALLVGQNFQLQRIWTEQYRNTGTFHVLVISGTHVAILAAFFLFLLRICFVPQGAAMLLTVLAAWVYTLVSGWGAPCVRSAAGLTLVMIAGFFYRERRPVNLLAAVALGFLVLDPEQLFDSSFQLSFLAVACLGLFATPLIRATSGPLARALTGLEDTGRDLHLEPRAAQFRVEMRLLAQTLRMALRLPGWLARLTVTLPARVVLFFWEVTLVSAVVQFGLALPMVIYFHRLGLSGISANALVVPLMGLAVPVGFVAVATGWPWVAHLGGCLLDISRVIVSWHASVEPNWHIPMPPLWLDVAFSAALIGMAFVQKRMACVFCGAAAACALALLLWHPFPPETHPGRLEMTAIDVGQGDSILLVFPDGRRMLVDGGGIPAFGHAARSQLDIGEDVVAPYLWQRGFRTLDAMVLSHAHEDHAGGLAALVNDFRPRELWTGVTPDGPAWEAVRRAALRNGTAIHPLVAPAQFAFGGARLAVLSPGADYISSGTPRNNDSLVLEVRYGGRSFFLPGDIERAVELDLLYEGAVRHQDVLKVAHHGSKTSSTEEFLAAASPAFALISAGFENSYGHPDSSVLERLAEHHTMTLRTDRDGLVTFLSDGRRIALDVPSEREP